MLISICLPQASLKATSILQLPSPSALPIQEHTDPKSWGLYLPKGSPIHSHTPILAATALVQAPSLSYQGLHQSPVLQTPTPQGL